MIAMRILASVLGFLLVALALLPLRFVLAHADLGAAGVSMRDASGLVWSGAIRDAGWRGAPLGDLHIALRPADLITGQFGVAFRAGGPVSSGLAVTPLGAADWRFEKLNARISLAQLAPDLPAEAAAFITNASFTPAATGCAAASGRLNIEGLPSPAPPSLEGQLRCEGGDVLSSVTAPQGGGAADIRVNLSDPASPTLTVRSGDPAMQMLLEQAGLPMEPAQ